jgi:hypothetical protein
VALAELGLVGAGSALASSAGGASSRCASGTAAGVALSAAAASTVRFLELFLAFALELFRDLDAERLRAWAVLFLALGADRFRAVEPAPALLSAAGS